MLLSNYITSAWRNILRHKLFSFINILGLAIGLAAVMLIALYVRYETSYDSFWKNADNIYRTQMTFQAPGQTPVLTAQTSFPVINAFKDTFPQIKSAARMRQQSTTFIVNGVPFKQDVSFADASITDIFNLDVIDGNLRATLNDNTSIALNQSLAQKYFNNNALGKIITIDFNGNKRDFKVNALIKDIPNNSQITIPALILLDQSDWKSEMESWFLAYGHLYYTLEDGSDVSDINNQSLDFIDKNFPHLPWGEPELKTSTAVTIKSLNIRETHLYSNPYGEYKMGGNIKTVIIFFVMAVLILIIAIFNFINLTTSNTTQRAKEVSVRKVMGASQNKLIFQFLGESVFLTLISFLMALVIVELMLPVFNEVMLKELKINYLSYDFLLMTFVTLMIGITSGIYPALVLSNFRPSHILKANNSSKSHFTNKFRQLLVIMQFTASIILFISTAVIYSQVLYARNMDLGFSTDNLFTINNLYNSDAIEKIPLLIDKFRQFPEVTNVSWANITPVGSPGGNQSIRTSNMPNGQSSLIGSARVGLNYFKTLGIPLLAGREYTEGYNDVSLNDKTVTQDDISKGKVPLGKLIINSAAVRHLELGTPDQAIGKFVGLNNIASPESELFYDHQIIGVVPDIYFDNLKTALRPEFYKFDEYYVDFIILKFKGDPISLLRKVQTIFREELPNLPLDYDFANDALAEQYKEEQGQMFMFAAFSGLAIFIACLGLFGLASFTAERRTKEIGIRKVMGASIFDIVKLLVWQFSKPVIIANIIAWPLSFYAMSRWLESFVYRIDNIIIIAMCLVAGLVALLIAWATVAGNSYAVARQNPIKALRYE